MELEADSPQRYVWMSSDKNRLDDLLRQLNEELIHPVEYAREIKRIAAEYGITV